MLLRDLLNLCYHYDSNVSKIKVIGVTATVKKEISNSSEVLLSTITIPIQQAFENEKLADFEVSDFGIEDTNTLFVKLV